MVENPYFLLLFILPVMFLLLRHRRYYLRHAYVQILAKTWLNRALLQAICTSIGWILLVLAVVNIYWGIIVIERRQPIHKYILINDGSGSMVDDNKERGVGKRLLPVYQGNEALLAMLDKRDDGSRDLVGAIVFSDDAFVVSYMVDEPKFVAKKLSLVDYKSPPMAQGTQLEKALWSGIDMILTNEKEPDADLNTLRTKMFGFGHEYKSDDIRDSLNKYRLIAENSCVIIFTDGEFDSPGGNASRMSVYKLLHLCKDLGIKVYVISVETIDSFVGRYTKDTGGFSVIFRNFEESKFRNAYENIVKSQSQSEIIIKQQVKKSLATIFAMAALGFLSIGLLLRLTLDRNFTEV